MNNDAILASISKIHAYRYAKEKQKGVLTANGGFSTTDPALRQTPFTIQCVIRPTKVTSTLQVAFNTKGDSSNLRVDLDKSGNIVIYGGRSILYNKPTNLNSIYDIVFVATDSQLSLFVDGTLITSAPYANTISIYNIGFYLGSNSLYFQGEYLLHRHFNYAMSADEVKRLDNNGNPLGYIVPKAMKSGDNKCIAEYLPQNLVATTRKGPQIEPTAETYEFNIGSPYSQTVVSGRQYPFDCIYRVGYVVDEWDFQPNVKRLIGFYGESGASVVAGVNSWIRKSDAKIGEVQSCFIKMPNEGNPSLLLYGDQDYDTTTSRRLKVTIKSITPISVVSTWLDSAKQLPWSDAYLLPLLQSKGGYDMVVNGAPEVLFNE